MKVSLSKIIKNSIYLNKIIIKHSPILLLFTIISALAEAWHPQTAKNQTKAVLPD